MPWCAAFVPPVPLRGQAPLHCTALCHAIGRERLRVERAEVAADGDTAIPTDVLPVEWATKQARREAKAMEKKRIKKEASEARERAMHARSEILVHYRKTAEPWDPLGLLRRYWTRATTRYGFSRRYGMVLGARESLMESFLGGFVLATGTAMCLAEGWRWRKEMLVWLGLSELANG